MSRYAPGRRSSRTKSSRTLQSTHSRRLDNARYRSLRHEQLEDRRLLTTAISIDDVTVIEGDTTPRLLDHYVANGSGGIDYPTGITFGPDVNGDGWDEAYVASANTDQILRYDGQSGTFLDVFVGDDPITVGEDESGGLDFPNAMLFGPDGNLYVGSNGTNQVLYYAGDTGAFIDVFVGDDPGTPGDESGGLQSPTNMLFGPDRDGDGIPDLYVGSGATNQVLCYEGDTGDFIDVFVGDEPGTPGDESGGLDYPVGMSFGPGTNSEGVEYFYLSSWNTGEVLRYEGDTGEFSDVFIPTGSGSIDGAGSFVFDLLGDGDLYLVSGGGAEVYRFDGATGDFIETIVTNGSGGLQNSWNLCFGPDDGNLYVTSSQTDAVLRYGDSSQAVFTISLSSPSDEAISVLFATSDGSAVAGNHFVDTSGTVVIEAGQMSRTVIVPTLVYPTAEGATTFLVTLSNPVGDATFEKSVGSAQIKDAPSVLGTVFEDTNGNGLQEAGEPGVADTKVFLDINHSGLWETGETRVWTSSDGSYQFIGLDEGEYNVLPESPLFTTPASLSGPALVGRVETDLAAPAQPSGLTWANESLYQLDRNSGTIYEINSETGETISEFQGPIGDLWDITTDDGVTFWAIDQAIDAVVQFDRTGAVLGSIAVPDSYLTGIASDGDSLWVLDRVAETVTQIDPAAGLTGVSFYAPGSGGHLDGLAFDGHNFWANRWLDPWVSSPSVVDQNRTYQFDLTGQQLLSFITPFARDHQALSLAHDGESLWIGQSLDEMLLKVRSYAGGQSTVVVGASVIDDVDMGIVQPGSVSGVVFDDGNGNGVQDGTELGLERQRVYLDVNQNGTYEFWEDTAFTQADGSYLIDEIPLGEYIVTSVLREPGWLMTAPATGSHVATIDVSGEALSDFDFGHRQTAFGPTGPEFLVNSTVDGSQLTASSVVLPNQRLAMDAAGNSVAVWQGAGPGDVDGVFGQRFDSAGAPVGPEFRVNTTTAGVQNVPLVAMADATGDFVVVWTSEGSVLAQRFNAAGNAVGNEFAVLAATSKVSGYAPAVAMDEDGDFVVVFKQFLVKGFTTTRTLMAQRFTSDGVPNGKAITVDNLRLINGTAGLGMDAVGNFVIVWSESEDTLDVWAQRYNANGTAIGSLVQVNPPSSNAYELYPSVDMKADGEFAVAWDSGAQQSPVVRFFDANGVPQSDPIQFGATDTYPGETDTSGPTGIFMLPDGGVALAWNITPSNRGGDIFAQRFDATGIPREEAFLVNTTTSGEQLSPSIHGDANGNLMIVWGGEGPGDAVGVFGQRYESVTIGNAPPVATSDTYIVVEDTELAVDAANGVLSNDTDEDDDALTAVLVSGASHGILALQPDGSFSYLPNADFYGTDGFTYRAFDATNLSTLATVTITVTPVNDAPVAEDDVASTPQDVPVTISVLSNDTDVDNISLTVDAVTDGSHGSVEINSNGTVTYTPVPLYNGSDTFTYTVSDGSGGTDTATVEITVQPLSDATVSVADLDGSSQQVNRKKWAATVFVTVHDFSGALVPNATVEGWWSSGLTMSASTDALGVARFDSGNVDTSFDSVTFEVRGIVAATLTYDPDGNSDPDGDSDGTSIEVTKPGLLMASGHLTSATRVDSLTLVQAESAATQGRGLWSRQVSTSLPSKIHIDIADLPAGILGLAYGNTITLDVNADGAGWNTDQTASPVGQFDLLTVVTHEMGHLLGYGHSEDQRDLMYATVPTGTQRLPGMLAVIPRDFAAAAHALPLLLPETWHSSLLMEGVNDTVLADTVLADTVLVSELGADSDTLLPPLVPADYLTSPHSRFQALEAWMLDDITDEETELLDEDLLDLIAADQS